MVWAIRCPVPVSRTQNSLQSSTVIVSASWGSVMRNTIAYPTQQSFSPSRGAPSSHKRRIGDRVIAV